MDDEALADAVVVGLEDKGEVWVPGYSRSQVRRVSTIIEDRLSGEGRVLLSEYGEWDGSDDVCVFTTSDRSATYRKETSRNGRWREKFVVDPWKEN